MVPHYNQIIDDRNFLFIETVQLINAAGMMELEYGRFAAPNESLDPGIEPQG